MKFLLDTCLLSEALALRPNDGVIAWLKSVNETDTVTSALVVGEIERGIRKLAGGEKKARLETWLHADFLERFRGRILGFDLPVALAWGTLVAKLELEGTPRPAIDTMLVATASVHGLIVVTRNVADFAGTGVALLNPWT